MLMIKFNSFNFALRWADETKSVTEQFAAKSQKLRRIISELKEKNTQLHNALVNKGISPGELDGENVLSRFVL